MGEDGARLGRNRRSVSDVGLPLARRMDGESRQREGEPDLHHCRLERGRTGEPVPPGFDPSDPGDPAYNWAELDAAVRSATSRGMQPVLNVNYAPASAEGPDRPSFEKVQAGAWDPQPKQLAFFTGAGAALLGALQRRGRRAAAPGPVLRGLGRGEPRHRPRPAVAGEQADRALALPAAAQCGLRGDPRRQQRGQSDRRWALPLRRPGAQRSGAAGLVLAIAALPSGLGAAAGQLPDPAHFDIAAPQPDQRRRAPNQRDRPVQHVQPRTSAASRRSCAGPCGRRRCQRARPKPFWSTEIWWDSKPPDPNGVPAHRHARFVTKSIYLALEAGVQRLHLVVHPRPVPRDRLRRDPAERPLLPGRPCEAGLTRPCRFCFPSSGAAARAGACSSGGRRRIQGGWRSRGRRPEAGRRSGT